MKNVNKKIYDKYQEDYNTNLRTVSDEGCVAVKKNDNIYGFHHVFYDEYKIFETDSYLSIVIVDSAYTECAGGYSHYNGYVINKESKKVMTNAEIIKMFNAKENVFIDEYNEAANIFDNNRATSIEDMEIFVLDGNLLVAIPGNGDTLMKYSNGQLENYNN